MYKTKTFNYMFDYLPKNVPLDTTCCTHNIVHRLVKGENSDDFGVGDKLTYARKGTIYIWCTRVVQCDIELILLVRGQHNIGHVFRCQIHSIVVYIEFHYCRASGANWEQIYGFLFGLVFEYYYQPLFVSYNSKRIK